LILQIRRTTGKEHNGFELLFLAIPESRLGQSIAASAVIAQVERTGKRNSGVQLLWQAPAAESNSASRIAVWR
jgi:hypothetical protein